MRWLIILLLCIPGILLSQQSILEDYEDLNAMPGLWKYIGPAEADSTYNWIRIKENDQLSQHGNASLNLEWSVHNSELYGGLSRLEYWLPSDSLLDLSFYDTLSFWYYNTSASHPSGMAELRFLLFDVRDSPQGVRTQESDSSEVFYSFLSVLDSDSGWNQVKIPLKQVEYISGSGFNLTGWWGKCGNEILDLDYIKGYALEFGAVASNDYLNVQGETNIDFLTAYTYRDRQDIIFNGTSFSPDVDVQYRGEEGSVEISEEEPFSGSRSLKWTTSESELNSGPVFRFEKPLNYIYHWHINPLSFKIRVGEGRGDLRILITDDDYDSDGPDRPYAAEYIIPRSHFNISGTWECFQIGLEYFDRFAGYDNGEFVEPGMMDSCRITTIQFLLADSAALGQVIYLDDIVLGQPWITGKPMQPEFVIIPDMAQCQNMIIWEDIMGEDRETYNIYFSHNPIDKYNFRTDEVELAAIELQEGTQSFCHELRTPLQSEMLAYHYSVTCVNAVGSESDPVETRYVTGQGRASAVINFVDDFNYTADGLLSEWDTFEPFTLNPSDGSGTVADGTTVDDEHDLSASVWLVCDREYLYVAFNIEDDSLVFYEMPGNLWNYDSPQMYIGLYDAHGWPHRELERGKEADFLLLFDPQGIHSIIPDDFVKDRETGDYFFAETDECHYCIEAKISFEELAGLERDSLFFPLAGMRIPIDFSINDRDDGEQREGILTYSKYNNDHSWEDVSLWSHTWIWDQVSEIPQDKALLPQNAYLGQNYPNPFNPTTFIEFYIAQPVHVSLNVYNLNGQLVQAISNGFYAKGLHRIRFDSGALSSGVYFYRISAGDFMKTLKMVVLH